MTGLRLVQDLTSGADCLLVSSGAVISCRGAAVVAAVGLQGHIATTAGVLILGAHSAAPVCMINRADAITRFPLLNTVFTTPVQSQQFTKVKAGVHLSSDPGFTGPLTEGSHGGG